MQGGSRPCPNIPGMVVKGSIYMGGDGTGGVFGPGVVDVHVGVGVDQVSVPGRTTLGMKFILGY